MFAVTFRQRLNGKHHLKCISTFTRLAVQGFDDRIKFAQKTTTMFDNNNDGDEKNCARRHSSDTQNADLFRFNRVGLRQNGVSGESGVENVLNSVYKRFVSLPDLNAVKLSEKDFGPMIASDGIGKGHFGQMNGCCQVNSCRTFTTSSVSCKGEEKSADASATLVNEQEEVKEPSPKLSARLKRAIRDYGATVIVFHVVISLLSFAICYLVVCVGVPVQKVIETLTFTSSFVQNATTGSTFLVSYILYKCFSPLRMACTLFCAPPLVQYLRRKGILTATKIVPPTIKKATKS